MSIEYFSGKITARTVRGEVTLAEGVSFSVADGETLALIGGSGSGKTIVACSMMHLLPRNVTANGMKFVFSGEDLSEKKNIRKLLGDRIVYIPQSGHEHLDPSRKVKHHIFDSLKRMKVPRKERGALMLRKLAAAGLDDPKRVAECYPFELSGGMAQRVVIAIGLCSRAEFVIADEPTNGLEDERKGEFVELIEELFPSAAKLVITHDISVAALADRVAVMCGGVVMEEGTAEEVLTSPRCPYTKALIGSLVENGMHEVPKLREQRGVCPFYSRCPEAEERCVTERVCRDA